jgi:hypothetical protein
MLRVWLFPSFSTAVLQTGPPTLGVRLNFAFYMGLVYSTAYLAVIILI